MKKIIFSLACVSCIVLANAQTNLDTSTGGSAVILKDVRLAVLEKKNTEKNIEAEKADRVVSSGNKNDTRKNTEVVRTSSSGIVLTSGYRLVVISSPDNALVNKVRGQLLSNFPDKLYMIFQLPNTKIKFGNFLSRPQAEAARKRIMALKIVSNNIYIMSDQVEMKVQKTIETTKEVEDKSGDNPKTPGNKKPAKPIKPKKLTKPVKATK